jgi:hypothetical protein
VKKIPEIVLNGGSGGNSNRGFKRIHVRTRRWRSKNHARGYQRLQESSQQMSQPDAQPSAAPRRKCDIGVSTEVLLTVRGTGHLDG